MSNDPDVKTPGRFVFTPDGVPCYPGWHHLWSRDWTSDDDKDPDALGEDAATKRKWHGGLAPYPFPLAKTIGSPRCIESSQELPYECPPIAVVACGDDLPDNLYLSCFNATGDFLAFEGFEGTLVRGTTPFVADGWFVSTGIDPGWGLGVITLGLVCFFDLPCLCTLQADGQVIKVQTPEGSQDPGAAPPYRLYYQFTDAFFPGVFHAKITFVDPAAVPLDPRKFIAGFDSRCYLAPPPPVRPVPDILDRGDMVRFGKAQVLLYDDAAAAADYVQDWLGPDAVLSFVADSDSVIPGTVIAVRPDLTVVIISGTSNRNQVISYTTMFILGTVDIGPFSTNLTWFLAAAAVQARISAAGADPAGRIILSGHSYGGAVAMLGAAAYKSWNPARPVDCISFGGPKPGDARLIERMGDTRLVRISNRGDPIPSLPPRGLEVLNFVGALSYPTVFLGWDIFRHKSGQLVLEADGVFAESDETTANLQYLTDLVNAYLTSNPMPVPFPHSAAEYVRRLQLVPPP